MLLSPKDSLEIEEDIGILSEESLEKNDFEGEEGCHNTSIFDVLSDSKSKKRKKRNRRPSYTVQGRRPSVSPAMLSKPSRLIFFFLRRKSFVVP